MATTPDPNTSRQDGPEGLGLVARQLVLFGSASLLAVALGDFCFHYLLFSEQLIRFFLF